MAKYLITGSRNVKDTTIITTELDKRIGFDDMIIHGGAIGVDQISEKWAVKTNTKSTVVLPVRKDISSYYLHRNAEMVSMCDAVIAFWDGESRGTKFTIDYAKARNKPVKIVGI